MCNACASDDDAEKDVDPADVNIYLAAISLHIKSYNTI